MIGGVGTQNAIAVWVVGQNAELLWEVLYNRILLWTSLLGDVGTIVYGYYLLGPSGDLIFCERFDSPIPISEAGQFVYVNPKVIIEGLAGSGKVAD
jgi:hypothetical protein